MTVQADFVATLIDEWSRAGVHHAVISPGSRSTPLSSALACDPRISVHVRLDERSAGFFAIGLARASSSPVIVVTTSGTAAAELHAAIVEADLAHVPLLCVTSDRPQELHRVGASQTVEQSGLFGDAVRFHCDLGVPNEANADSWRSIASRLVAEAASAVRGPGPIHLNVSFRDPLVGVGKAFGPGRRQGLPWHRSLGSPRCSAEEINELSSLFSGRAGIIVVGDRGCPSGDPNAFFRLADVLGWPVIADPRAFPRTVESRLIAHCDGIFRSPRAAEELRPEVVVQFGSSHLSKSFTAMCARAQANGAVQVNIDSFGGFEDPERAAHVIVAGAPEDVALRCATVLSGDPSPAPREWFDRFARADAAIEKAISDRLDASALTEPGVIREVFARAPEHSTLVVAASMPVRDLEWFTATRDGAPTVVFNGGANGIDGVISSALGVAVGALDRSCHLPPVTAIVGDLTFFHDLSGLVWGDHEDVPTATFVVLDNGGGGIFSFLPQADAFDAPTYERIMATPQRADVGEVARALGCTVHEASPTSLVDVLEKSWSEPGISVIVARTNRAENRALHDELERAITLAVDGVLASSSS